MTYYQCLIQNDYKRKLVWLPEEFCEPKKSLKIRFRDWENWIVKEVYFWHEEIYDSNKLIWTGKAYDLSGDRLKERLILDRKMIQPSMVKHEINSL